MFHRRARVTGYSSLLICIVGFDFHFILGHQQMLRINNIERSHLMSERQVIRTELQNKKDKRNSVSSETVNDKNTFYFHY